MQGSSRMHRVDTTLTYVYVDSLLYPGSVQQYKYRINAGDTASGHQELVNQPNRIIRIPDTLLTVTNDFDNYNPGKRPMTFQCDMAFYVKAGYFDPEAGFLDVAGNFSAPWFNDVLFDTDRDTIYSIDLQLDTTWFQQGPLTFKFRINGDWNTAELQGKPDRTYIFHDTLNQDPNIYSCFYNDLDPSVPTPPRAYNVGIQGLLIYKKFLSGIYAYENVNGIPEGISTYRWLRSSNAEGTDAVPIDSAWSITYVVDTLDISKWLVFEVTPVAASGDSAVGAPVRVVSSNNISAWDVGMGEKSWLISRIYPNPVTNYITVEAKEKIDRITLLNYLNQPVLVKASIESSVVRIDMKDIPKGMYILKATTKGGLTGVSRVIKL
jgi:hypothetical protein